jgi:hypothetical protein
VCQVKRRRKERTSYNTKRTAALATTDNDPVLDDAMTDSLLEIKKSEKVAVDEGFLSDFDVQTLILPTAAFSDRFLLFSSRNKSAHDVRHTL